MKFRSLFLASSVFAAIAVLVGPLPGQAQTVVDSDQMAPKTVSLRDVTVKHNVVSGEIVNRSPHLVRDVEVLVQYHWMWKDEFDPGENPPGRAYYVALKQSIEPGASVPFNYTPKALPNSGKQGYFMPEVSIAGFSVVITPEQLASR